MYGFEYHRCDWLISEVVSCGSFESVRDRLGLEHHPEGGAFLRLGKLGEGEHYNAGERGRASQILYLMGPRETKDGLSRLHVLNDAAESWFCVYGDPVEFYMFHPGRNSRVDRAVLSVGDGVLGRRLLVPAGTWQAARALPVEEGCRGFTLFMTTVCPEFLWEGHSLIDPESRSQLIARFPDYEDLICSLSGF